MSVRAAVAAVAIPALAEPTNSAEAETTEIVVGPLVSAPPGGGPPPPPPPSCPPPPPSWGSLVKSLSLSEATARGRVRLRRGGARVARREAPARSPGSPLEVSLSGGTWTRISRPPTLAFKE